MRGKKERGITLIALIITIIVMLILVTVTVTSAINGGIFDKAGEAVSKTDESITNEKEKVDELLAEWDRIEENCDHQWGEWQDDGENMQKRTCEKCGKEETQEKKEYLPTTGEPYIGCYADLNGDGEITTDADGIIYADLAHSANGKWNSDSDSGYKYDAVDTSSLKSYEIVGQCEGKFGETEKVDVIAPVEGTGTKDRFYVMALEDLDNSTHHWYYAADGNLNNLVSADIINFTEDSGKKNTKDMLDIYGKTVENGGYGEPVPEESLYDLWAMTKLKDKNEEKMGGWFVPSRVEWSAFGDMLYTEKKITKSNYYHYLKGLYWSSSQYNNRLAWTANFSSPTYYMDHNYVRDWLHVRLSATF